MAPDKRLQGDYGRGSMGRNILSQAIPMFLAELTHLLYNVVDRIYIGHLPGTDSMALAGLGITFPLTVLVSAFSRLIGAGGAPLFSIARGAGDRDRAARLQGTSFSWLLGLSVLVFTVCMVFRRPILFLFGAGEQSFLYAERYLRVYLWGTPFVMIATGMNGFINAQGFPRVGMITVALGAVLNLALDPLFIFALGLSVEGAALATVLSQAASALFVTAFLTGKKALIPLRKKDLGLRLPMAGEICRLGLAGSIMSATTSLTQIACNVTLQTYGGETWVSAMAVLQSVREILSLPVGSIHSGCLPVLGFNYGAKKYRRVTRGIRFVTFSSILAAMISWVSVLLFAPAYTRIFTDDPAILEIAPGALRVFFFAFVFMALQTAGQAAFTSMGKSRQAIFFSLFRKAIIVTPLTFLLPLVIDPPVYGVFWAEPISNVIGGTACFTVMYLTVYRKLVRDRTDSPAGT